MGVLGHFVVLIMDVLRHFVMLARGVVSALIYFSFVGRDKRGKHEIQGNEWPALRHTKSIMHLDLGYQL